MNINVKERKKKRNISGLMKKLERKRGRKKNQYKCNNKERKKTERQNMVIRNK